MRLFYSAASPFVRKVLVLLRETNQLDDVEIVAATGTPLDSTSMPTDHNPLGKIPTLVLDNEKALFDSRVICRFLDDRAGGVLYPSGLELWDTLTLEAMADGVMDAAILMVYEKRLRAEEMISNDWMQGQWGKVSRALDATEDQWIDHMAGPLDMAQVALGCALSYLDFRHGDRNWREGRPKLAAWEAKFAQRESMVATVPAG